MNIHYYTVIFPNGTSKKWACLGSPKIGQRTWDYLPLSQDKYYNPPAYCWEIVEITEDKTTAWVEKTNNYE